MQGRLNRRQLLSGLAAAGVVTGFDPIRRCWISAAEAQSSGITVPGLDGELVFDQPARDEAADDFGHIVHQQPLAVLRPGSIADVERMVRFANQHDLTVSTRGQAHSTYGQAQAAGGVVIDSRTLSQIESITADRAVVQMGVRWIDLLQATLAQGLTPPVLTDYIELSVGGTLSVGGIGGATSRHGFQVDNVLELEVVTGEGNRFVCSPTQRPALFNSVLAGLGQFAIIVRATVRLIPAPTSARVYRLFYDNVAAFTAAQRVALADERFHYLEGNITLLEAGGVSYQLEAAAYYTPPAAPNDAALLAGLNPLPGTTVIEEHTYFDWANRLAPLVAFLKSVGAWSLPHPFFDVFLPNESADAYIASAISGLTLAETGNGPILCYPFKRSKSTRPFLSLPASNTVFIFDILRFAPPDPTIVQAMLDDNRALYEQARSVGGKKYPIGSIPFETGDWIQHYGNLSAAFIAAKAAHDPCKVLTPGQGIFRRP